jgi:hypothetical protein
MTADLPDPGTAAWPGPVALDALRSAPRHHTLLLEKRTRASAGDPHSTRGPGTGAHTLLAERALRPQLERLHSTRPKRTVVVDSRALGAGDSLPGVLWSDALPPHSLENVGAAEIRVISVELKPVAA